ncbi:hypothetical protein [Cyanothece sp. BG0011]|uniref:hypothetical protein n=1 Tax=Cyanothece sp. BG0011 TaxID=2082950 RepID=UPI000D1EAF71|nr:hypothetical protein [Cyanothece sp. BG0011]
MKIVQTKGKISDGVLKIKLDQNFSDEEVDVVIIAKNEPDEFEEMRQRAKKNGYDSTEQKLELIQKVKLEMLAEKGRSK